MTNKKVKNILLATILVSLVAVASAIAVLTYKKNPNLQTSSLEDSAEKKGASANEEPSVDFFCPICGEKVFEEEKVIRRPLAIVIENHSDTRPQSGLEKACLIYETVAEGGITRFLAVYLHNDCGNIGPVRSAREYFAEWAKSFEALFAHCGGSPTAFEAIKRLNVDSLNQFYNGKAYWRVKTRKAPHNLYTSTEKLFNYAREKGFSLEIKCDHYNFKDDIPLAERPSVQRIVSIEIDFSGKNYKVRYEYDEKTNSYKRFLNGSPHIDNNSGNQLAPKNVAVMYTSIKVTDTMSRRKIVTIGEGKAQIFLDGNLIKGKWKRQSAKELTRFYDENGKEIKFNRGQIWIEVISPDRKVSLATEETPVTTPTP